MSGPKSMNTSPAQRGFTLVELMIAITIGLLAIQQAGTGTCT